MKVLILLALLFAVALGQNTCFRPLEATEFTGKLPLAGKLSPVHENLVAGWAVSVTFGANNAVVELQTNGTHSLGYQAEWKINNLVLNVNYATATSTVSDANVHVPLSKAEFDCDPATVGQYQVRWDVLCTRLSLELVQDFCIPRRFKYSGLVLNRVGNVECPARVMERKLGQPVKLYNAQYVNFNPANELSGLDVNFVVRPGTSGRDVLEQSFRGTRRSNWRFTDHHLFVYDVSSRPKFLQCHEYNNIGMYLVNWYTCDRFILTLVSDTCRGRRDVYADMAISANGIDISPSFNAAASAVPSFAILVLTSALLALF